MFDRQPRPYHRLSHFERVMHLVALGLSLLIVVIGIALFAAFREDTVESLDRATDAQHAMTIALAYRARQLHDPTTRCALAGSTVALNVARQALLLSGETPPVVANAGQWQIEFDGTGEQQSTLTVYRQAGTQRLHVRTLHVAPPGSHHSRGFLTAAFSGRTCP